MQQIHTPIAMEGLRNLRELGGYTTNSGAVTQEKRFLRGDSTSTLTQKDQMFLYDYGVRCIIDLRSTLEAAYQPSRMNKYKGISYYNVPMMDNMHQKNTTYAATKCLYDLYEQLLTHGQEEFLRVFSIMLQHLNQGILFHCAAGKDRTGLVAMMLLSLADVPEDTIIADYAVSENYLAPWQERQKTLMNLQGFHVPQEMLGSNATNMKRAVAWIGSQYGSAQAYLKHIGLSEHDLALLKDRLLTP